MAIDTLAKLTSRVGYLANRDDLFATVTTGPTTIESAIDVAIQNATKTLSRDLSRRGGTALQEIVNDTLVTIAGTETVALPAALAGIRLFGIRTDPFVTLVPRDFVTLVNDYPSTATNKPAEYAQVAITTAYLRPIPDAVYSLRLIYFNNLAALTASVTNPIFDNNPDVYEAASMVEVALLMEDEAAANRWRVVYDQKMNDLTGQDKMSGWAAAMSGATPSVQVNIA